MHGTAEREPTFADLNFSPRDYLAFLKTLNKVNGFERHQRIKTRGFLIVGAILIALSLTGLVNLSGPLTGAVGAMIALHEFGHYVGMRLFGYHGARMMILPFVADSASGVRTHTSPLREGIVILLGPLPGLFVGLLLSIAAVLEFSDWLLHAAIVFVAFNTISLLPCLPFDGGRLLQRVILVRQRLAMAGVQVMLSSLVVLVGGLLRMETAMWIGVGGLLWAGYNYRLDGVAERLRPRIRVADNPNLSTIPFEVAAQIVQELRGRVPISLRFGMDGWSVRSIWERMSARPAGWGTIAMVLGAYAAAMVLIMASLLILVCYPEEHVAAVAMPDGGEKHVATISLLGERCFEIDVSDKGYYHGEQVEYLWKSDRVIARGQWVNGFMEGEWTRMDEAGNPLTRMVLDRGQIESVEKFRDGRWVELGTSELSWLDRYDLWRHRRHAPEGPRIDD